MFLLTTCGLPKTNALERSCTNEAFPAPSALVLDTVVFCGCIVFEPSPSSSFRPGNVCSRGGPIFQTTQPPSFLACLYIVLSLDPRRCKRSSQLSHCHTKISLVNYYVYLSILDRGATRALRAGKGEVRKWRYTRQRQHNANLR